MNTSTRVRLRPAPRWEPPYDEEPAGRGVRSLTEQAPLPLTFLLSSGVPARPETLAGTGATDRPGVDTEAVDQPTLTGPGQPVSAAAAPSVDEPSSEVKAWTAQLAQAVVDVLAGDRPATQLLRWTTDEVQASVRRRAAVASLQRPRARGPRQRARVRSVRVCEPVAGVAEASAVVSRDGRVVALALRLEARGTRWQCTALEGG